MPIKPMHFSDDLYRLLYGKDVDIESVRRIKDIKDVYNDAMMLLANNDITKLKYIREMKATDFLDALSSKVKTSMLEKIKDNINPIGFKK